MRMDVSRPPLRKPQPRDPRGGYACVRSGDHRYQRGRDARRRARRSGRNYIGNRIAMSTDVANELRQICTDTVNAISRRTAVAYTDDLDFDS
jgi:hypothetical protein